MKRIHILFLLVLSIFFFDSCRKEEIIKEDPIVTIDPSEEIEYPVVKGIVTNNGKPIPEANVNVYQNETFVGTITTNEEGKFNSSKYELDKEAKVTLEFSKTDYANAYRRREVSDLVDNELDVNLVVLDIFDTGTDPVDNPGSTSLISLSGYIKDLIGQPSIAFIGVQWEVGNTNYASTTYPDLNGYYELLLPISTEVKLSISDTICENYLTEQEVIIFSSIQAEYFGPFVDDITLPDYINPISTKPFTIIQGTVNDCNGEPSLSTEISFNFNDNETFDYYIVNALDSDGVFEYMNSLCLKLPYDLSIFAFDYVNNKTTDTLHYTIMEPVTEITLPDFRACNQGDLSASTVTINSEGNFHVFSLTMVRKEGSDLISDELTVNAATFKIPDVQFGTNDIVNFSALNWGTGAAFIGVEGTIELEITTLSDHIAIGNFSGSFTNTNNEVVEATGQVNLNF